MYTGRCFSFYKFTVYNGLNYYCTRQIDNGGGVSSRLQKKVQFFVFFIGFIAAVR